MAQRKVDSLTSQLSTLTLKLVPKLSCTDSKLIRDVDRLIEFYSRYEKSRYTFFLEKFIDRSLRKVEDRGILYKMKRLVDKRYSEVVNKVQEEEDDE